MCMRDNKSFCPFLATFASFLLLSSPVLIVGFDWERTCILVFLYLDGHDHVHNSHDGNVDANYDQG